MASVLWKSLEKSDWGWRKFAREEGEEGRGGRGQGAREELAEGGGKVSWWRPVLGG